MIRSLKTRLLLWLILPFIMVSLIALYDTRLFAIKTANNLFDQTLASSSVAIAERVIVADDGFLDVDIPYIALEMLSADSQDRIFYRINANESEYVTGYKDLFVTGSIKNKITLSHDQEVTFYDGTFRGDKIRVASIKGYAISATRTINFEVLLAETTTSRDEFARDILFSTGWRIALLIFTASIFVWIGINLGLNPLRNLARAIKRRSPQDLHPITHIAPIEVETLIASINNFMARLENSLGALRNFTANAEHQIKTPLSIAKTNIYLAKNCEDEEEKKAHLETADKSINNCERILSQLISLSKIENEMLNQSQEQFDLVAHVKGCILSKYAEAKTHNIRLEFENLLGQDEVGILGNKLLLSEAIHNIIHNIFLHSKNCDQISCKIVNESKYYDVIIADNGHGIDAKMHKKVLKRFEQISPTENQGSGLGLSIVDEIMHVFKGKVALSETDPTNKDNPGLTIKLSFRKTLL